MTPEQLDEALAALAADYARDPLLRWEINQQYLRNFMSEDTFVFPKNARTYADYLAETNAAQEAASPAPEVDTETPEPEPEPTTPEPAPRPTRPRKA